jgi:hypothetical protein
MIATVSRLLQNCRGNWRLIPVLILALLFLVFVVWRTRLHFEVQSKIKAVQQAGLPTRGAELNGWMAPVGNDENGALVLEQAFGKMDTSAAILTANERPRLIATNRWPTEVRTRVQTFLQRNASPLAEIDRALKFRRFRFPVDYTPGFATELPQLRASKEAAVLLSLRTALSAEEGREWSQFLQRQIEFGEALNEEPTVIGFLVRCACLQIALNTAERSLAFSAPELDRCQRLSSVLLRAAETNLLPRSLIAERAIIMPVFRTVPDLSEFSAEDTEEETPASTSRPRSYNGFLRAVGFFDRDLNFYLGSMAAASDLAEKPAPGNLLLTNLFDNFHREAKEHFYLFSGMLLPALGRVSIRQATVQANLRMAAVAFAIEGYQQMNGKLPADLEQLRPNFLNDVPLDPFVGQPLRYSVLSNGYRLYSVGSDGVDNGGLPAPKRTRGAALSKFDLTFTVAKEDR